MKISARLGLYLDHDLLKARMAHLSISIASAVLLKKFTCIHHVTMLLYTTVYWALLLSEDEN